MKYLVKTKTFHRHDRAGMDLSNGVRLNPETNRLELEEKLGGFSTDLNLYATASPINPEAVRKWVGFHADVTNFKDSSGNVVTGVRYKLNNGEEDLWWNAGAAAWVSADYFHWNTEEEVASNISKYPHRKIVLKATLYTSSAEVTPHLSAVHFLAETDLVYIDDYIRSITMAMQEQIRPVARASYVYSQQAQLLELKGQYDAQDLESVYNVTKDPERMSPLAASMTFSGETMTVTLEEEQTAGDRIDVRFTYKPFIMVNNSQDFYEVTRLPAVSIEDTETMDKRRFSLTPYVINKETGAGVQLTNAYQVDIRFYMRLVTQYLHDNLALMDAIERFFSDNQQLHVRGQDEFYNMDMTRDYEDRSQVDDRQLRIARIVVFIRSAVFYQSSKQIFAVKDVGLTLKAK